MTEPTIKHFYRSDRGAIYILRSDGTLWFGEHYQSGGSDVQLFPLQIEYMELSAPTYRMSNPANKEDIPIS